MHRELKSPFLINANYVHCLLLLCLLYCYPYAEASKLYTDRGHDNSFILTARHSKQNGSLNRHKTWTECFQNTLFTALVVPTPSQQRFLLPMGATIWNWRNQASSPPSPPLIRFHSRFCTGHNLATGVCYQPSG